MVVKKSTQKIGRGDVRKQDLWGLDKSVSQKPVKKAGWGRGTEGNPMEVSVCGALSVVLAPYSLTTMALQSQITAECECDRSKGREVTPISGRQELGSVLSCSAGRGSGLFHGER